jgi:hypothetical protein
MLWSILGKAGSTAAKSKAGKSVQKAAKKTKKKVLKPLKKFKFRVPVLKAYEKLGDYSTQGRDYVGQRLWNFMGGEPMKYPGFLGTTGFQGEGMQGPPGGVVQWRPPAGEAMGPAVYQVTRPVAGPQVVNHYG